jgi:heme exporter protein A
VEEGRICWRGQDIRSDLEGFHRELGYLGHDNALKADLTAEENLRFAAGLRGRVQRSDLMAALTRTGSAQCAGQRVRHLSAGQRRRVALAQMVLTARTLWVLDEPASNLDADGQGLVLDLLQAHLEEGGGAVVATHQALILPPGRLFGLALQ